MADYSYIDFDKFEPTEYPNWGYQNSGGTEAVIYYPTGEVWTLGEVCGWHDNTTYDLVVFMDADANVFCPIVTWMAGASVSTVEEAIDFLSYKVGYELG